MRDCLPVSEPVSVYVCLLFNHGTCMVVHMYVSPIVTSDHSDCVYRFGLTNE